MYVQRQGLLYHRLAVVYHQSYQRLDASDEANETRRKKLLQLCRLYYEKSARVHEFAGNFVEYVRVQCSRLELQEQLVEGKRITFFSYTQYSLFLNLFSSCYNVQCQAPFPSSVAGDRSTIDQCPGCPGQCSGRHNNHIAKPNAWPSPDYFAKFNQIEHKQ